jgi:hypothetical protein
MQKSNQAQSRIVPRRQNEFDKWSQIGELAGPKGSGRENGAFSGGDSEALKFEIMEVKLCLIPLEKKSRAAGSSPRSGRVWP